MTVVVVGPTAVGKSRLAVALARRFADEGIAAEIVSADSMLVYTGMDIGTAKPTEAERDGVRHHLIDIFPPARTATVAEFQRLARSAIADCRSRGVRPILVGGSALYIRSIVDDFVFPGTDPRIRARLEGELAEIGPERLHQRLADIDPAAAVQILPGNARRVVRALEVVELTGTPFQAGLPPFRYARPEVMQIGLQIDRAVLDQRIATRVEAMWAAGLVDEVRRLADHGLRDGLTASRALGYRQVLRYLDGEISEKQARELTIVGTRKFARRQDSWFRKDPRISWLPFDHPELVQAAATLVRSSAAGPRRVVPNG